jgi:WD40 repeat protein
VAAWRRASSLTHDRPLHAVACPPDGSQVAAADDLGAIIVWDVDSGKKLHALDDAIDQQAFGITFERVPGGIRVTRVLPASPAGLAGLKASDVVRTFRNVPLDGLTLERVNALLRVPVATEVRIQVATSKDMPRLVSVNLRGEAVHALAFSPDGRWLAAAVEDGGVRLWELGQSRVPRRLRGHKGAVTSIAFNSDGTILASAGRDGQTRLWRVLDGSELAALPEHEEAVCAVVFTGDGRQLITGSADRTVRLWDIAELRRK